MWTKKQRYIPKTIVYGGSPKCLASHPDGKLCEARGEGRSFLADKRGLFVGVSHL